MLSPIQLYVFFCRLWILIQTWKTVLPKTSVGSLQRRHVALALTRKFAHDTWPSSPSTLVLQKCRILRINAVRRGRTTHWAGSTTSGNSERETLVRWQHLYPNNHRSQEGLLLTSFRCRTNRARTGRRETRG